MENATYFAPPGCPSCAAPSTTIRSGQLGRWGGANTKWGSSLWNWNVKVNDFAGYFWRFQAMVSKPKMKSLDSGYSLKLKHLNLFHCSINYVFCNVTASAWSHPSPASVRTKETKSGPPHRCPACTRHRALVQNKSECHKIVHHQTGTRQLMQWCSGLASSHHSDGCSLCSGLEP